MIVVDASVIIKCLLPEDGSEQALSLLDTQTCIAPDLIVHECVNALWKNAKVGRARRERVFEALALFLNLNLDLTSSSRLAPRALELAIALDHPAYDCFYLALAERHGIDLVIVDGAFARKVTESGVSRVRLRSLKEIRPL